MYINSCQDNWVYWLLMAEFAYNNSVYSMLGVLPYFLKTSQNSLVDNMIRSLDESKLLLNSRAALDKVYALIKH